MLDNSMLLAQVALLMPTVTCQNVLKYLKHEACPPHNGPWWRELAPSVRFPKRMLAFGG